MAPALVWSHEQTTVPKPPGESARRKAVLPPVIQQIANERAEYEINLGRAMDTLRRDMPTILSQTPGKPLSLKLPRAQTRTFARHVFSAALNNGACDAHGRLTSPVVLLSQILVFITSASA